MDSESGQLSDNLWSGVDFVQMFFISKKNCGN